MERAEDAGDPGDEGCEGETPKRHFLAALGASDLEQGFAEGKRVLAAQARSNRGRRSSTAENLWESRRQEASASSKGTASV